MDASLRKRIITISGIPCSGKSTVNRILKENLNYNSYSVGFLVKKLALEQNTDPETFYEQNIIEINEEKKSLDEYLDAYQQELGEKEEKFILDSRLGFYFVPQSFRIFLLCDMQESARRAYHARKENPAYATEKYQSVAKAQDTLTRRTSFEKKQYAEKYGIPNFQERCHFDIIINTTEKKPEAVSDEILKEYLIYEKRTKEIELVRNSFQTMLSRKIVYFSCPITGGKRLYQIMKKQGISKKEDLTKEIFEEKVVKYNIKRNNLMGEQVKRKNKGVLISPGNLGNLGWSQRDYLDLWKEIIRTKATHLIFQEGWEYSDGAVEEYLLATTLNKPTLDHKSNELNKNKAIKLVSNAVRKAHELNNKCPKLEFLLEQLKR